ncbi:hypothetical protein RN001_010722 [Aquatica leii]|uniref:Peptidase S1 domain-containing protein n=1 Tax=Aquatica leii TaxID=1421715 RepID=A0AAN7PA33_9COLE|nr:hypothetical protein RN001_010722 [Aquatica leii]
MALFAVLAIIASVLVQTHGFILKPRFDSRIVGGEDADIADYPYQLSFQYYGAHLCGASLIGNAVALTAAHCTVSYPNNVKIRAGSNFTYTGGELVDVIGITQHPKYDIFSIDYDVSVLKLSELVSLGLPVNLQPSGQEITVGALAVVTGFGALYEGGASHHQLQKVEVPHIDQSTCNEVFGNGVTNRMTCFGSLEKDFCYGDNGGPLVYARNQVGIVSWGYGCARPGYPGVYTKIANSEINAYIVQKMNEENYYCTNKTGTF